MCFEELFENFSKDAFTRLNEGMKRSFLAWFAGQIDLSWQDPRTEERLDQLKLCLQLVSLSSTEEDNLGALSRKISNKMDHKAFLAILIPLERSWGRGVQDSDMLVTYKDDKSSRQRPTRDVVLIAENIRSAFNLGSIFRTAECMGVGKVYLTGYTATPEDGKVRKTTMGTHEWIMWEWVRDPCQLIHDLKVEGYLVVGLETADKALTLADVKEQPKIALVLGNERFGVDKETLSLCDQVVKIRTFGRKNSLNVGVACGMALQSLLGEGPSN